MVAFVADDERIIRRGIKNLLEKDKDIDTVYEAQNGIEALEKIMEVCPDIIFLDIRMPLMDGLELAKRVKAKVKKALIIMVTGHDEFSYAQKAIRLNVFDYILKPISDEKFFATLEKAKKNIRESQKEKKFLQWAESTLEYNEEQLKSQVLYKWLHRDINFEELLHQIEYLDVKLPVQANIVLFSILNKISTKAATVSGWKDGLLAYGIQNMAKELFEPFHVIAVLGIEKENIVVLTNYTLYQSMREKAEQLKELVRKHMDWGINYTCKCVQNIRKLPEAYADLKDELYEKNLHIPIIEKVCGYIDKNYYKEDLTLKEVADYIHISSQHLSRLFSMVMNMTFVDYLINVRISRAVELLMDPTLRICEISEKVGYSSQHYFSSAFKKVMGTSPNHYRRGFVKGSV